MKSYEQFISDVKDNIREYLPEEYRDAEILIDQNIKNNNQKLDYIAVHGKGNRVEPIVYLGEMYSNYQRTGDFEDTMKQIAAFYLPERILDFDKLNVPDILSYEKIKDQLIVQVVNFEANQEQLSNMPHKKIPNTDLAVLFRIKIQQIEKATASIKVTMDMFSGWNTELDTVYEVALQNTKSQNPFVVQNMEDILFHDSSGEDIKAEEIPVLEEYQMYVLSTKNGANGSTAMLYPDLLEQIGERYQSDFFILPSSIHELILVKDNGELDAEELQRMVLEINMSQVDPEEQLSNQVFAYHRKEQSLVMLTSPEQTRELAEKINSQIQEQRLDEEWDEFLER